MTDLTTITTKGQVTIPENIRRVLGAKIGDKIYFSRIEPDKKQAVINLISKNEVENLYGSLKSEGKYIDIKEVREKSIKSLVENYGLK